MPVAKLTLEIEIHQAHSLKDRRQVVRSLRDTIRRSFNASIAELDETPLYNRASFGIVAISRSPSYLSGQMQQIERAAHRICNQFGATVIDSYAEMLDDDAPAEP